MICGCLINSSYMVHSKDVLSGPPLLLVSSVKPHHFKINYLSLSV